MLLIQHSTDIRFERTELLPVSHRGRRSVMIAFLCTFSPV